MLVAYLKCLLNRSSNANNRYVIYLYIFIEYNLYWVGQLYINILQLIIINHFHCCKCVKCIFGGKSITPQGNDVLLKVPKPNFSRISRSFILEIYTSMSPYTAPMSYWPYCGLLTLLVCLPELYSIDYPKVIFGKRQTASTARVQLPSGSRSGKKLIPTTQQLMPSFICQAWFWRSLIF